MTLPPATTRQLRSIVREHGPIEEPADVLEEASAMEGVVYGERGWEVE